MSLKGIGFQVSGFRKREAAQPLQTKLPTAHCPLPTGRGFTLVELLVSVSILLLIISVALIRFTSFDSVVLLKSLTYDIGLSVRTAQTYSLSVLGSEDTSFRSRYGVSFTPNSTEYYLFGYYESGPEPPRYNNDANDFLVDTFELGRSFVISDVCVISGTTESCNSQSEVTINRLDISFIRPEYRSYFYAKDFSGSIDTAVIKVQSQRDTSFTGRIEVGYTGQISVSLEPS